MSVTVTLHLWWLGLYLAAGVVLYLPLNYLAHRRTNARGGSLWQALTRGGWRRTTAAALVQVAAWPLAVWELARWVR